MAHPTPPASVLRVDEIRHAAHRLDTPDDHHARLAERDRLGTARDRLQAGRARLVHRLGRHGVRQPGAPATLPGRIRPRPRLPRVSNPDIVDVLRPDAGPMQRGSRRHRTQFRRMDPPQRSAVLADGGTRRAQDDDIRRQHNLRIIAELRRTARSRARPRRRPLPNLRPSARMEIAFDDAHHPHRRWRDWLYAGQGARARPRPSRRRSRPRHRRPLPLARRELRARQRHQRRGAPTRRRRIVRPGHRLHRARRGEHCRLLHRQEPGRHQDGLLRVAGRLSGIGGWRRQSPRALRRRPGHLAGGAAGRGHRAHHRRPRRDRRRNLRRRPGPAARIPPRTGLSAHGRPPRLAKPPARRGDGGGQTRRHHHDPTWQHTAAAGRQGNCHGAARCHVGDRSQGRAGRRELAQRAAGHNHRRRRRRVPPGAAARSAP